MAQAGIPSIALNHQARHLAAPETESLQKCTIAIQSEAMRVNAAPQHVTQTSENGIHYGMAG